MKKLRFLMPIWFLVIASAFSVIVMLLWNWLMPNIFGFTAINFWQALGLFALTRILFGNFGFLNKARRMHEAYHDEKANSMLQKWTKMSDEQRKEFLERRRKFGFGHPHPFCDIKEYDEEHGTEDK